LNFSSRASTSALARARAVEYAKVRYVGFRAQRGIRRQTGYRAFDWREQRSPFLDKTEHRPARAIDDLIPNREARAFHAPCTNSL
jgi:hypothetical protein